MATAATIKPSSFRPQPTPSSFPPSQTQAKHNRSVRPAEPVLQSRPPVMTAAPNASPAATSPAAAVGASPSVTSRDGSTCDACYRRKSRCAMNESVNKCYSCDFHRQECTFTLSSQLGKRKLDETSLDGAESVKRPATASSASSISGGMPESLLRNAVTVNSASALREDPYLTGQHIGMTTELEPLLLDYLTLDHNDESPLSTSRVRKFSEEGTFMRMADSSQARMELHTISIDAIDNLVTPFGPTLIDKFFQHVHPTFPVLMEDNFRHSYQTRRNLSPSLLAAVYLLALKWLDLGRGIQTLRKPDATRLEAMATRLFTESLSRAHTSTIQAGLILSQKSPLNTPLLISQLVTIGYDLGLHQDCSNWKMEQWEKGLRKRLAWALYVQDKWCGLVHGRPSHIFPSNWTVKDLCQQDFIDTYSSKRKNTNGSIGSPGPILFRRMVTLSVILSDILNAFYTLQATEDFTLAGIHRTRAVLERAKPIQIRLKEWFSQLPEELKMDPNGGEEASFNGGLHLAYFATEITLHRCIVRSLTSDSADNYLSHICRSAAKTRLISAMDFVNRLRPIHLRSFWPSASRTNFALISAFGILLRATAVSREEEEFYRMRLGEYRWTLSVSCKDAEFLVFAIDSLDVATCLLRNVPDKPEIDELMAAVSPPSHYDQQKRPQLQQQQLQQQDRESLSYQDSQTINYITIGHDHDSDEDAEEEDYEELYDELEENENDISMNSHIAHAARETRLGYPGTMSGLTSPVTSISEITHLHGPLGAVSM
ncbi:hypothetical protein AJ80_04557 [Polytolypa hystricis UAMH7299]|uniref:Zn(2)-C6 fungal-type domain-containing protein n=1 Tax=Polytolypa hystricis (strain UAMH7299) TaxID=1447883 RepID=A0A2B7YAF1_POLH7|nr:hypothetical protein AJ80_04557 [Polytolypa hystricis UAMH7299]